MTGDLFAEKTSRPVDTRPVLVGMNNPLSRNPDYALFPSPDGCAGQRLWAMLDEAANRKGSLVPKFGYLRSFDRRNVLSAREWSSAEALRAGLRLMDEISGRTVVVCGVQTARALRLPRLPWCEWGEHSHLPEPTRYCIIPHPSGRCREYNDPSMRERVGDLLLKLYLGAGGG